MVLQAGDCWEVGEYSQWPKSKRLLLALSMWATTADAYKKVSRYLDIQDLLRRRHEDMVIIRWCDGRERSPAL
jgi:hypothetical protein